MLNISFRWAAVFVALCVRTTGLQAEAGTPGISCNALNDSAQRAISQASIRAPVSVSVAVLCAGAILTYAGDHETSRLYVLGSVTKGITATAIMRLRSSGKLRLTDSAAKYVPELNSRPAITIYDLLTHQSGLADVARAIMYDTGSRARFSDIRTAVAQIASIPDLEPDSRVQHYSSTDFIVLGLVIENVTHERYEQYVTREIGEPSSAHFRYSSDVDSLSKFPGLFEERSIARTLVATGGVIATARDIAGFDHALLVGTILSSDETTKMFEPRGTGNARLSMGWFAGRFGDRDAVWHDGAVGNHRAVNILLPADGIALVILSSDIAVSPIQMALEILRESAPAHPI